jgi:hypothetical protein
LKINKIDINLDAAKARGLMVKEEEMVEVGEFNAET